MTPLPATTRAEHAKSIRSAWEASIRNVLETGKRLVAAKTELAHGEFGAMVDADLPFGRRHAQRLIAIATDQRLAKTTRVSHFLEQYPADIGALYELTRLSDEDFATGKDEGWICPETDRQEISLRLKAKKRAERVEELAERTEKASIGAQNRKYGVILMDPAWEYKTYNDVTGGSRAAANHYPVMSIEEIMELPVADWAAPDCVIFMWVTGTHLDQGIDLIRHYGFDYKSNAIWVKDKIITGFWFRFKHEQVLVAVRGHVPAPALGTQMDSVFDGPVKEHSRKPDDIHEYIEKHFPGVPKLEMNARRARPGWDTWGNEAPLEDAPADAVETIDPSTGEITLEPAPTEMPDVPNFLKRTS